jgi:capsular polysaccharide biosynthesis protein
MVLEVPDVIINGPNGLKITQNGQYVVFNYWRHPLNKSASRDLAYDIVYGLEHGVVPELQPSVPPDLPEVDVAVSLLGKHATNYTHWAQECLTLLEGVEVFTRATGIEPCILIPPDPPKFIWESLEAMGYDESNCLEWAHSRLRVNRLVLPTPRRCLITDTERYFRMPSGLEWVRNRARSLVPATPLSGASTRILISREDATSRRIVNRDEVKQALADRGFKQFVTGEMSYREQVGLFSKADFVIGGHGAGMINTLYAGGAGVIELYGSHYLPANYEIAENIGLKYGCLQCDPVGVDLHVNIDELELALDRIEAA